MKVSRKRMKTVGECQLISGARTKKESRTSTDVIYNCCCWFALTIMLLNIMLTASTSGQQHIINALVSPRQSYHHRQSSDDGYLKSELPQRTILQLLDLNGIGGNKYGFTRALADEVDERNFDGDYPDDLTPLLQRKSKKSAKTKPSNRRRERRTAPIAESSASFSVPKECYQRYANSDYHQSLVDWLHRKNASHYSPISPSYHQALLKIQTDELIHGLQVTSGASACSSRKMRVISSSTPLRERAVCQFEYVLNYKPNRIPSTFTEVKCSCPKPSGNLIGRRMFECEPLRYQVRVLLFDEECLSFTEHTETIALACIPVLQANANADERADVIIPVQTAPELPT